MTLRPRTDPRVSGMRGYIAAVAKHGEAHMAACRRLGGRKPDPTYDEIILRQAGTDPTDRSRRGERPRYKKGDQQ